MSKLIPVALNCIQRRKQVFQCALTVVLGMVFVALFFWLGEASPAINKGFHTWVTHDIDGEARPDWCFFDIGMDEHITGKGCEHIFLPLVRR